MISLARRSLIYDWKRYLAAVMALAFAALLMVVQIGLLLGMFGTVSVVLDRSAADLWVSAPNVNSFDLCRDFPARYEALLRCNPEVTSVQRMILTYSDWKAPDGSKTAVTLVGMDLTDPAAAFPDGVPSRLKSALKEPDTVLIDAVDGRKLHGQIGDCAEINDHKVKVVGVIGGFRAIGGAYILSSLQTARTILGTTYNSDRTPYLAVKLRRSDQAPAVQQELQQRSNKYKVWRTEELSRQSQWYWLRESGAGAGVAFSTVLGVIVGTVITMQTLKSAIMASLKEYATLRALGVPLTSLYMVVMKQSFWLGIAALALATVLTTGLVVAADALRVALVIPAWLPVSAVIFTMTVALLSGALAVSGLFHSEPAELLR